MTLVIDKKTLRNYKLKKLLYIVLNYLKSQKKADNIRIYGVHNTLFVNDEINEKVEKDINKNKDKSIIVFMDFDRNEERINKMVTKIKEKIGDYPIVYLNDKKEGKLVYVISKILSKLHNKDYQVTYFDDNQFNLDDAKKYADKLNYKLNITKI